MDKENAAQAPITPLPRKRAAGAVSRSPKRVARAYRSERTAAIPFGAPPQPSVDDAFLARLESVSLDGAVRERLLGLCARGDAVRGAAPPRPPPRRRRWRLPGTGGTSAAAARAAAAHAHLASPEEQAGALRGKHASRMPVDRVKHLRVALASEAPAWVHRFLAAGGYTLLCARLREFLALEWRDEQHDDALMHELLRCLVSLATTDGGRAAMEAQAPQPFVALAELLFSRKRPAELATRKLIIDLLAVLPRLALPRAERAADAPAFIESAIAAGAAPGAVLALQLLHAPDTDARDACVDFLQRAHTERPLRRYVAELATVQEEFFWIFCHEDNQVWDWDTLDARAAAAPRVPGGMTGGVEWEAMQYATAHLRLLNTLGACLLDAGDGRAAPLFYDALARSGCAPVLDAFRRSSQTYYAPMHLELSRYGAQSRAAGGERAPVEEKPSVRAASVTHVVSEPAQAERPPPAARPPPAPPALRPVGAPAMPTGGARVAVRRAEPETGVIPASRTVSTVRRVGIERDTLPASRRHGPASRPAAAARRAASDTAAAPELDAELLRDISAALSIDTDTLLGAP